MALGAEAPSNTMSDEDRLLEAYRRTHFCADTPQGRIVIQVDQLCPTVDTLLRETGCSTWAYITAFNPGSVPLNEAENQMRQLNLEQAVRQASWFPLGIRAATLGGPYRPCQ